MRNRFILTEEEKNNILSLYGKNLILEQRPTTTTEIKAFQDYMDTVGPWVKSSSGKYVKLNKGGGYGTFGPNTSAAWNAYGEDFLQSMGSDTDNIATNANFGAGTSLANGIVTQSSAGGDCINVEVSGVFGVAVASNPNHIKNFLNTFIRGINENAMLKESYEAGTLYVGGMSLVGGASNYYGGSVKPDVDNNYQPTTSAKTYYGNYAKNKALALKRAQNLYNQLLVELPKLRINFGQNVNPTFDSMVVDTGGKNDNARASTYKNPGQIVRCKIDLCGVKALGGGGTPPEPITTTPPLTTNTATTTTTKTTITPTETVQIKECFENAEIEVNYVGTGHKCNYAVYEIYVNGIKLKRDSGQDYASLNNMGDFDNAVKEGEHRFNKFTISKITAQEFVNLENLYKYQGNLQIDAKCVLKNPQLSKGWPDPDNNGTPNGGCHKGVGKVVARVNGKEYEKEARTPNKYEESIMLANFPACKALYEKAIQSGNQTDNPKVPTNDNVA